jgi:hypothetical protein
LVLSIVSCLYPASCELAACRAANVNHTRGAIRTAAH